MYNLLLDAPVYDRSWYDIAEALQLKIAYTCLRGKPEAAAYHLNVMDLIDTEASAYWREWGLDLYSGKIAAIRHDVRRTEQVAYSDPPAIYGSDFAGISLL
jgi:hypothetical protein